MRHAWWKRCLEITVSAILILAAGAGPAFGEDAPEGEKPPAPAEEIDPAPATPPPPEGEGEDEASPPTGKAGGKGKESGPPEVILVPYKVRYKEKKKESLLVLEPRAISYKWLFERFRVGSDGVEGTRISPGDDLGIDGVQFLSPQINTELSFPVFGMEARLRFSYSDTTLHGVAALDRDLRMSRTLFPAGTVVGSQFTHRRASLRYFQKIVESPMLDVDIAIGADYLFFRNVMHSPGFSRQRDATESALPVLGARGFLSVTDWGEAFVRLTGFYWNLGRSTGETGIFELSLGFAVHFSKTWGIHLDLSMAWISIRKGMHSRVAIDYWEIGPGLAVYASL